MMRKKWMIIVLICSLCLFPGLSAWATDEKPVEEETEEDFFGETEEEIPEEETLESGEELQEEATPEEEEELVSEEMPGTTEEVGNDEYEEIPIEEGDISMEEEEDTLESEEWDEETEETEDTEELEEEPVQYNVFCVDYGTEEILAASDEEEIAGDEEVYFEDILAELDEEGSDDS